MDDTVPDTVEDDAEDDAEDDDDEEENQEDEDESHNNNNTTTNDHTHPWGDLDLSGNANDFYKWYWYWNLFWICTCRLQSEDYLLGVTSSCSSHVSFLSMQLLLALTVGGNGGGGTRNVNNASVVKEDNGANTQLKAFMWKNTCLLLVEACCSRENHGGSGDF